jgi:hypothetical protein
MAASQETPASQSFGNSGLSHEKTFELAGFEHKYEIVLEEITKEEALTIGADWLEITDGKPVGYEQYQNIHDNDYASFSPADAVKIFGSWENYSEQAAKFHASRTMAKKAQETDLWKKARRERDSGLLPPILFTDAASYKIDSPGISNKRRLTRWEFLDKEASKDVIVSRLHRYNLVEKLAQNKPSGKEMTDERKINIALGFSAQTGAPVSSLLGSLKNSIVGLSNEDIIRAAEDMDSYDYIFPKSRQSHLRELKRAASVKPINLNYTSSFPRGLLNVEVDELYYDLSRTELIIGKTAVASATNQNNIESLTDLLLKDGAELPRHRNNNRFKGWSKEDCQSYGRWLLKLLETQGEDLTIYKLERASRLRLGLGVVGIKRLYDGSLLNYFADLGLPKKNARGAYEDMSYNDVLSYIRSVAEQNKGRISRKVLTEHYQASKQEGLKVPSPAVIERIAEKKIGAVLEDAGFKLRRKVDTEKCVAAIARFFAENNRMPLVEDIATTSYLHSYPTIRRYCGSLGKAHELAEEFIKGVNEGQRNQPALAA